MDFLWGFIGVVALIVVAFIKWSKSDKTAPQPVAPLSTPASKAATTESLPEKNSAQPSNSKAKSEVTIVYSSVSGTSRQLAHKLFSGIVTDQPQLNPKIVNASEYDPESLPTEKVVVFILSTYDQGKPPKNSQAFFNLLSDMSVDHRYGPAFLKGTSFAVFGLGDKAYGDQYFNKFGKDVVGHLKSLGAKSLCPPVFTAPSQVQTLFPVFLKNILRHIGKMKKESGAVAEEKVAPEEYDESDEEAEEPQGDGDLEEIATDGRQLVYPLLEKNLSKQGYQIIGSHSGVKLCRWTKSMLRGRGGCYKHTFYNISSFQCMEMTPSLACANKCVFCWRHHTNPVSRGFTWEMDPPEFLVEQALEKHRQMVKQMKGVPGVQPERLEAAMKIKHCALSLVGEPIIYPEINKFVTLLHKEKVSTFMVTNSQFPDRIKQLLPVTQLYCSVDAATPEELKRIDRPIFEDYWKRCVDSLKEMSRKKQRTVFRLTLVKNFNSENVENYAALVRLGNPDFIEVKGVTFAGDSKSSDALTMKNVPYHHEVIQFCQQMVAAVNVGVKDAPTSRDPDVLSALAEVQNEAPAKPFGTYAIACEHAHSCCVLIAKDVFRRNGAWHTWIDYDRFFELAAQGTDFTSVDYAAPTPSWAEYQSPEQGFDPNETRVKRKE